MLNVEEFEGKIELVSNHISDNMVFIPEAIAQNNIKFNKTAYNPLEDDTFADIYIESDYAQDSYLLF